LNLIKFSNRSHDPVSNVYSAAIGLKIIKIFNFFELAARAIRFRHLKTNQVFFKFQV